MQGTQVALCCMAGWQSRASQTVKAEKCTATAVAAHMRRQDWPCKALGLCSMKAGAHGHGFWVSEAGCRRVAIQGQHVQHIGTDAWEHGKARTFRPRASGAIMHRALKHVSCATN